MKIQKEVQRIVISKQHLFDNFVKLKTLNTKNVCECSPALVLKVIPCCDPGGDW
jgi:hypothetical protein